MAKTPSEKMRDYRKRLKEKGGREFSIILSPEDVKMIEILGKYNLPNLKIEEIVREMIKKDCNRLRKMIQEQVRLKNEFGADSALVEDYIQFEIVRNQITTAEEFLIFRKELGE